jgi:hypothetical protein
MKTTTLKTAVFASLACLALESSPLLAQSCTDGQDPVLVSGKINNNIQDPRFGFTTLGVVVMKVGGGKMKCGIIGQEPMYPASGNSEGGNDDALSFIHTISCDDSVVPAPDGVSYIHSQLTLATTGTTFNEQPCNIPGAPLPESFSFHEDSIPLSFPGVGSSGRGVFAGVTEGYISIDGTASCFGSIDMKFEGYVCPPSIEN